MKMSKQKRKIEQENREFKKEWTESYAFIANATGFPLCLICSAKLSNNKKSNIERHFMNKHDSFARTYPVGEARKKAVDELLLNATTENSFSAWIRSSNTASFVVSREIVMRGKPFADGDYVKECFVKMSEKLFTEFKNKSEIISKINDMPLSERVVADRVLRMSEDVTEQQIADLKSAPGFSIACDRSCKGNDISRIALVCRYVNSKGPQEELLELLSLPGRTHIEDVESAIAECFNSKGIDINKIISIATDGTSSSKGFIELFKKRIEHDMFSFHCIVHQDALCSQIFPAEITVAMDPIAKIVDKISKHSDSQQFDELLEEVDRQYSDRLTHYEIGWLSRGAVLMRFAESIEEIKSLLRRNNFDTDEYALLEDPGWLQKFYFIVDMTLHLNMFNKKLQRKGNTAVMLLEEVLSFEQKLCAFTRDLEKGTLLHFPMLKKYRDSNNNSVDLILFEQAIVNLRYEFSGRFKEFRKEKVTLSFLLKPLEVDTSKLNFSSFPGVNEAEFELELEDLKTKDLWNSKLKNLTTEIEDLERQKAALAMRSEWSSMELKKQDQVVFDAWNSLPDTYMQLKTYAFGLLSIFGSTCFCEQIFSNTNLVNNILRNRLTDTSLSSYIKLKITTYSPNIEKLSRELQLHVSQC